MFTAGGDATSTYIPLKVLSDSTGVLQGFDIFTADGTKIIDKNTGLTDAAITVVAQATGSAVSTVSKTTNTETASDAQKITNGDTAQTVTLTAIKDGDGMLGFDNSLSGAIADVPSSITVKILKSSNENLSSPTTLATRTITRNSTSTNNGGTDSANVFVITTESESEPGFEFHFVNVNKSSNTNVFSSAGDMVTTVTHSLSANETAYFFTEITGVGGNGAGSNNRTSTASRTISITAASGRTFTIDTSGNSSESGDGDITAVVAGSGMTGGATSGAATLNVIGGDGITVNADEVEVTVDDTTIQLSNTNGSGAVQAKTAAVSNGGTALATGDQIHDFVTGLGYTTNTGTVTEAFKTIAVSERQVL